MTKTAIYAKKKTMRRKKNKMTAPLKPKLLKESTFQNVLTAEQERNATLANLLTAEQARNTSFEKLLTAIETKSTDIPAWVTAALGLPTVQKTALKSALYEVLGLNNSVQKSIEALPDIFAILDDNADAENGAGLHNSLFRGKNLGASLTADQSARIQDGTFKGLWAGDYHQKSITFSYKNCQDNDAATSVTATHDMVIGDHDYRRRSGDEELTAHHILTFPRTHLFLAHMNATNITDGGYVGSEMYTKYLDGALNAFKAFYGENHILKYRNLLVNAVANGKPSGHGWYSRYIDLMNEPMTYGSFMLASGSQDGGATQYRRHTIDRAQIAAFRLCPELAFTRSYWCWLRDVVSAAWFADVYTYGLSGCSDASVVGGVRPAALIC